MMDALKALRITKGFGAILLLLVALAKSSHLTDKFSFLESSFLRDNFFQFCEVIFVSVQENGTNKISTSIKTQKSALPFASEFDSDYLLAFSSGIFTVSSTTSAIKSYQFVTFKRLLDVHKYNTRQCAVSLIYASKVTNELPKWLFDSLTPRYVPIIRKDEDYFVLMTQTDEEANKLLLSPEFGLKVKYKIGISLSSSNHSREIVALKTVSLYSEINGEPRISTSVISGNMIGEMQSLFPDTTYNFHQKQFRVANPKAPFYFEMKPKLNGKGNVPVRGLYKVWLDVMMERFNFSIYLFQSSLSGGTGKRLKNGTWLGAVADVLSEKAEMAVYIGHIYNRHEFVEWSKPLTHEWLVFITHKSRSFYSSASIFKPFPISLWIGFIASLVAICLILKLIVKNVFGSTSVLPARKMLIYLFASFMEQDADYYLTIMTLSPVRMLVAFWLLFALIISTAYRGKLVSLIAFPKQTWVPRTFDELAYSNYRVGVNVLGKGGAAYSILSTSNSPVYVSLFNRMEIYPDPAVCLREALYKDIGCIMWKSVADSTEAKNFTDKFGRKPFRASEQTTSFIADGYIWEKRAVFRHHFDRLTCSIVETGLSTFWFQSDLNVLKTRRLDWERKRDALGNSTKSSTQNNISLDDGPSTLKLIHLIGLFLLFSGGNLLGLFSFFLEWIWNKFNGMFPKNSGGIDDDENIALEDTSAGRNY